MVEKFFGYGTDYFSVESNGQRIEVEKSIRPITKITEPIRRSMSMIE